MRYAARTAVLIGALLALAACGGGDDNGAGGGDAEASLSMVENAFEPAGLTVAAGSELSVSNDGEAVYNITIEGTSIDEDVEAGQSASVTIDATLRPRRGNDRNRSMIPRVQPWPDVPGRLGSSSPRLQTRGPHGTHRSAWS